MKLFLIGVTGGHRAGRGQWWRANRSGYTWKLEHAGVYTEREAIGITKHSDRSTMVEVDDDMLERLEARETELMAGVAAISLIRDAARLAKL